MLIRSTYMQPVVVIHYHEIALKGGNRAQFEYQLMRNIRASLDAVIPTHVHRMSGRIVLRFSDQTRMDDFLTKGIVDRLLCVFGIANVLVGYEVRQESVELASDVVIVMRQWVETHLVRTFAVRAKRSGRTYPETSVALERRLGATLVEATGLSVDLEQPDCTVFVEIVERTAFVLLEKRLGPGGLPVGVSGNVLALLSSGFDSPVASWMCMKRGAVVQFVHFHSYPYTSDASIRNVRDIVQQLTMWQGAAVLVTIPLIDFQRAVMMEAPHALRVLLYRRMMVRVAELIAREEGSQALVTGESLGQVASQTLTNIAAVDGVVAMPVLRPLIGFDKLEIIRTAERIGTAPISQRPYDDCCSLFTPEHPETAARAADLDRAEHTLAYAEWIPKLFDQKSREIIGRSEESHGA